MRFFRSFFLLLLGVLFSALPAAAQGAGHGAGLFTREEARKLQVYGQEFAQAFRYKEYDKALENLKLQAEIFEKGIQRIESGKVSLGEKPELSKSAYLLQVSNNYYNQACCLSILEKKEAAVAALKRSIDLGFRDYGHIIHDEDLKNIREDPGYVAAVKALQMNDVVAVHVPEGLPEGPRPLIVLLHPDNGNEKIIGEWKDVAKELGAVLAAPRGPITPILDRTPEGLKRDRYRWRRTTDDLEPGFAKIRATLEKVEKEQKIDASRVVLVGFGEGGMFGSLTALSEAGKVRGVVSVNAYWNKWRAKGYFAAAKEKGVRVCLVHGKEAPHHDNAKSGVEALTAAGIPAKLVEYEGGKELPANIKDLVKGAIRWVLGEQ